MAALLAGFRSEGPYRGWGLGFPYVSRFVNVPAGVPNAYTTISAAESLLDAADAGAGSQALKAAGDGCRFMLEGLGTFKSRGRRWQRYWPGSDLRDPIAAGASAFHTSRVL